jgi:hypothetical protein
MPKCLPVFNVRCSTAPSWIRISRTTPSPRKLCVSFQKVDHLTRSEKRILIVAFPFERSRRSFHHPFHFPIDFPSLAGPDYLHLATFHGHSKLAEMGSFPTLVSLQGRWASLLCSACVAIFSTRSAEGEPKSSLARLADARFTRSDRVCPSCSTLFRDGILGAKPPDPKACHWRVRLSQKSLL